MSWRIAFLVVLLAVSFVLMGCPSGGGGEGEGEGEGAGASEGQGEGAGEVLALFSANPTSGEAPLVVEFIDESTAKGAGKRTKTTTITEWIWSFGDGTTSDQRRPYHIYTEPGTYTVSLTVQDTLNDFEDTVVATNFITVAPGTDTDGDNLSDTLEQSIGTDPNLWDTDGDTFSDGKEYFSDILDPLVPDAQPAAGVTVLNNEPNLTIESYDATTGILVFVYSGSAKQAPSFSAGDVLIFAPGRDTQVKGFFRDLGGFARDVAGRVVSVVTETVFDGIRYTVSLVNPELAEILSGIDKTWTQEVVLRPAGMPMVNEPLFSFKGMSPGAYGAYGAKAISVEVDIDRLDFVITGALSIRLLIEDGSLILLSGEVDGNMTIWLDVTATASASFSRTFNADLGTVLIPLGPIPATADLQLDAALYLSFDGTAQVSAGFDQNAAVRFGFTYLHSSRTVTPIQEFEAGGSFHTPEFTLNARAEATLTLIPKVGISLYSVAGAYVGVRPYLSAYAETASSQWQDCLLTAGVDVGIDAFASLEADLFIAEFSAEVAFPDVPLSSTLWPPANESGCIVPVGGGVDGQGEGEGEGSGGWEGQGETDTILLPGNVPLEMVSIPAGTFMMGRYSGEEDSYSDEDPQHQVTISNAFWLGKYEVTKAQWTAVMETTPWSGQSYVLDDPDSPAVYVSWNDAQAFITALNALTEQSFRLPSEAEWEYACRAGTTTRFSYGDDSGYFQLGNYAWWRENAWDAGEQYAHMVGQKLPNPWELYDMHGNVWEWCQDWHGSYSSGAVTDPAGPGSGSYRVLRGGGWNYYGYHCRSAYRGGSSPGSAGGSVGFRLAR